VLKKTRARKAELVVNYRKTILTAFQNVEYALAAVKKLDATNRAGWRGKGSTTHI